MANEAIVCALKSTTRKTKGPDRFYVGVDRRGMQIKEDMKNILISMSVFLISTLSYADIIYLKNGNTLECKVIKKDKEKKKLIVDMGNNNSMELGLDEIVKIVPTQDVPTEKGAIASADRLYAEYKTHKDNLSKNMAALETYKEDLANLPLDKFEKKYDEYFEYNTLVKIEKEVSYCLECLSKKDKTTEESIEYQKLLQQRQEILEKLSLTKPTKIKSPKEDDQKIQELKTETYWNCAVNDIRDCDLNLNEIKRSYTFITSDIDSKMCQETLESIRGFYTLGLESIEKAEKELKYILEYPNVPEDTLERIRKEVKRVREKRDTFIQYGSQVMLSTENMIERLRREEKEKKQKEQQEKQQQQQIQKRQLQLQERQVQIQEQQLELQQQNSNKK